MSEQEPSPIIVVDDDFEHLTMVSALLTHAGYHCLSFSSACDARNYIDQNPVDLVITDIFMPDMDGFEMLRTIREVRPGVAVITVSGEGRMPNVFYLECAMQLGAVAALRKPFDPNALIAIVTRHVGHRAYKSPSNSLLQTEQP